MIELSLIIPAFNEAENISLVVDDAREILAAGRLAGQYELIIVDDGSTDATGVNADELAKRFPDVKVCHHPRNMGYGAALKTGIAASTGQSISVIPGDGEIRADQPVQLHSHIVDADIVVSRRIRDSTARRGILTWGLQTLMRLVLGFDATEIDGIWVARRTLVDRLQLVSDSGLLHSEVVMRAFRSGARVARGEIRTRPRLSGQSKVANAKTMVRILWEMLKLGRRG